MKRIVFILALILIFATNLFAQKIVGFGGELSILSLKPNYRMWLSKTTGFEVFGGVASELEYFDPNDVEAGFKFLHTLIYERTSRTYIGVIGKWKWVNVNNSDQSTNLPIPGILIGKEWFSKRVMRKGFAVEFGYQVGTKDYRVYDPTKVSPGTIRFEEFPLILNLRYSFYSKR
jgi:hypothetical protein